MNYRNDDMRSRQSRSVKQPKRAGRMPGECPKRAKAVQEILDRLGNSSAVEQPAVNRPVPGSIPGFPAILWNTVAQELSVQIARVPPTFVLPTKRHEPG